MVILSDAGIGPSCKPVSHTQRSVAFEDNIIAESTTDKSINKYLSELSDIPEENIKMNKSENSLTESSEQLTRVSLKIVLR